MKILVTGAAGFIGMTASLKLLARGDEVVGLDNLNDYYDVNLKHSRLKRLTPQSNFRFVQMDVADRAGIADEDGVEVRAVAASSITGVVDVTTSPTLAALVVFNS